MTEDSDRRANLLAYLRKCSAAAASDEEYGDLAMACLKTAAHRDLAVLVAGLVREPWA